VAEQVEDLRVAQRQRLIAGRSRSRWSRWFRRGKAAAEEAGSCLGHVMDGAAIDRILEP
jgi:hypothetical protein